MIQIHKSLYNYCLAHKEINPESRKAFKNFPETTHVDLGSYILTGNTMMTASLF